MNNRVQPKETITPVPDLFNHSSWRHGFVLIPIALALFAFVPWARAVSPPPDGGYFNGNTAEGQDALFNLTTGKFNTAIGVNALQSNTSGGGNTATGALTLTSNKTGTANTAAGAFALSNNTTGFDNTATGAGALQLNMIGSDNTANGFDALVSNTAGSNNTANGSFSLFKNKTGSSNTATGVSTLLSNTTGNNNTATGVQALNSNTTGSGNTATGYQALYGDARNPSTGSANTADGNKTLYSNTTGIANTAQGNRALSKNTSGGGNAAHGGFALSRNTTGVNNTAAGFDALYGNTTGSRNIALGTNAGVYLTTGNDNIDIGNVGTAGEASTIRIGTKETHTATFIAGISGSTVPAGVGVIVGTGGRLGTIVSSARFKDDIKPMDKASEALLSLKPVTFHYKHDLDPDGILQFGLVAEEVAKINPDLVARDEQGRPYTVRYDAVNAMLLNEFLKAHRTAQEQEATIAQLKSAVAEQKNSFDLAVARQQEEIKRLTAGVKEQAVQVQRASEQIQMNKVAARIVDNR